MTAGNSAGWSVLAAATVDDLEHRPHARVVTTTALGAVVEQMQVMGRGCALVEDGGKLVGIFTERDLLQRVDRGDDNWRERAVSAVMTREPVTIRASDSLAQALRHMTGRRLRHLPIVDERDQVRGLISVRDILAYIAGRFPEELLNLPPDPTHE